MSRHLGDLGKRKSLEDAPTFGWFGATVHVRPGFSLHVVDFLDKANGLDESDPRAQMLVRESLSLMVAEEDWPEFWRLALENGQELTDLMAVMQAVMEAESGGRPTRRRSGSSAGRRKTSERSTDDSSSRVIRRLERSGRSDLAEIVDLAARSTG